MSDSENSSSGVQEADPDVQPYVDAADRLERTLDAQLQTIRNIDSRAGFIIRVVGILLGVVVSAASILATVSTNATGGGLAFSVVAMAAAIVGTVGLLGAMVIAIITYLSSNPLAGLEYQTADLLSSANYEPNLKTHLRRTLGVYAYALQVNGRVIQVNAARFRLSLVALVSGVVYGTLAAALVVAQLGSLVLEGGLFGVVTLATGLIVWYVLTERYKVAQPQLEHTNE
ncbi:hypothetical protein [Halococcus sp. PRR34]|uniref:hypothetical protein n=1 Tax=Halococcus sp. PRR34 TaxID=3020830 RepID=UPI0023610B9A|nr:hypothetical protein [Halococcus sp. PRR34]